MDVMFTLIGKIFNDAREKENEMDAMCAITILMNILDHVKGIEASLVNIIQFFYSELT
jgi:hypothetical protein